MKTGLRTLFSVRWILTTLLVLAGVAVLIRLGIWQLDRLAQRRAFNSRVLAVINLPKLDLNRDLSLDQLYNMEYRTSITRGEYDFSQQVLLRNQVWDDREGYRLLTPLKIAGSQKAVLVDRGWIPYDAANSLQQFNEPGIVTVVGQLRRPQSKPDFGGVADLPLAPGQKRLEAWNIVNLARIQQQISLQMLPVYIQQAPDPAWKNLPYRSLSPVDLTEGPHFGYALQWFAFSAILGLGYPFFVRKQLKKAHSQEDDAETGEESLKSQGDRTDTPERKSKPINVS